MIQVPDWMLSIKKVKPKERRRMEVTAPQRRRISTVSGYDLHKSRIKASAIERSKKLKQGDRSHGGKRRRVNDEI